ncbi:hypothetical protein B0T21DRAFT_406549 [Apiosordaria backusii]|uniref:Uncharacterized protein n=1 Tax=Apiosordaria backusii TaxID=314023 RepID=A0AA40EYP8_9PEZI|nr:hypothetical protein B0T21DRAFT_406549 [Apiosordaria backusii]
MKFTLSTTILAVLATTTALASPIIEKRQSADPKFVCPSRIQAYCSAPNVHTFCDQTGLLHSDALDICGRCICN